MVRWFCRVLIGGTTQCLVVINGLHSKEEWRLIKSILASFKITGHIIVITNDESVATNCADHENRVINVNDTALHPSMQIHGYMDELFWRLRHRRVICVCGAAGDTSTLLKQVYAGIKHQHVGFNEVDKFDYYVWVDVPHPFDVEEFRLRLFQSWFPDVIEHDELSESFRMACEKKCIFIINGLQSTEDWEFMKPYFVKGAPKTRTIVIANEESVAKHFVEDPETNNAIPPLTKASDYYGYEDNKKASRSIFLSNMIQVELQGFQGSVSMEIWHQREHTGVISVWGIAGVGKSTVVRAQYDACMRECSLVGKFAWVDVPYPLDLVEFSRLLLLDFHRCDLDAMEAAAIGIMQGEDPIQGCREILCQDGYVVIIDGLRSTYDWDLIETAFLSQPTTMARIVVITTEESIAKHSVKQEVDRMINVKCLEDDVAYRIFEKIIDPEQLESVKEKVDLAKLVAKCGGLPKVVCAMGKVSGSLLEHMNDDFMVKVETDPEFNSLRGLLSWMHSYFDACSDLVKPCIFYLSIFPASTHIRQRRLLRRWIAEGYFRDTAGCTAKENAQKLFSELIELSIIQQPRKKDICQVNSFFREYIISRPMEDNLVFALDGRCSPNTPRTGQHLTIKADWHRDQNVFESIDLTRLWSLTIFGEWSSFFISEKMKQLRVLDLEDMITVTNDDIEQIFVKLLSLKFISLRGCRKISRLPDTLGGLKQLRTLDVRFTSIVMLPSAIIRLQKLQYIRAGTIVLPDDDWTSASSEDADGVTSQLPAATSTELEGRDSSIPAGRPIAPTSPENGTVESLARAATLPEAQHMQPKMGWSSKLSRGVTWSMCGSESGEVSLHHYGVEVPVGIEKLVALHTVGVVNVNASGGEAFLKHLTRLGQLLKLRVCGINKKNWPLLCSALSDKDCHLESLSVRFDEDCLDDSFKPPMTLKTLKLHGPIRKLPDTIKVLVNLRKLDLEITITRQEDMHLFLKGKLPRMSILNRLCINLQEDQKLDFGSEEFEYNQDSESCEPRVLKIDCSSKSEVRFGGIFKHVKVLIIQCSEGSSFRVSGSKGLERIPALNTVWLKGSYSEELQQHLKELVDEHYEKPVLKLTPL